MLDQWEDVLGATENLATWCYNLSQMVNPDSETLRNVANMGELLSEVDQRFKKEVSIGFRLIKHLLNKAMEPAAEVKEPESHWFD